jgi:hypothetical protein
MKENMISKGDLKFPKALRMIIAMFFLTAFLSTSAVAQQYLNLEWNYTYQSGLSCRYPMNVTIYYSLSDGSTYQFAIFKYPGYTPAPEDNHPFTSSKNRQIYVPPGVTVSTIRIAAGYVNNQGKCPNLPSGRLCYTDGVFNINYSATDVCVWGETAPAFCGLNGFKVSANLSPVSGTPVIQQGTVKPYYCPDEKITFEVPCNMKSRGYTFTWYYREGTGFQQSFKTTTSETIIVGEGNDYTAKAGVNTYLSVRATNGSATYTSDISGSFRYGAHAPTATITPRPPTCADGDDWSIDITAASSTDAVITSFKANIFHSTNATSFPDGFVTFDGPTKTLTKAAIGSSRVFAPGTKFRMTIQNDYNTTTYGACETALSDTYTIPNAPEITIVENIISHKDLACHNVLTGGFQINVSNGNGNYTVKLNGTIFPIKAGSPLHQPIIENLDGGTYTVKINDTNCEADSITIVVKEPAPLLASIAVVKPLDCSNSTDGELKVNISGGTAPYSINWSNGNTVPVATALSKGTHTVTVKDQGCPLISTSHVLNAPDPIIVSLATTAPKCPGSSDGSIHISDIQNAPGTLTYLWNTGETSSQLLGISQGNYGVTVTSSFAGKTCTGSASVLLSDPALWTATIKPVNAYNGAAISCNGASDGRLDVILKDDVGQEVNGEYYTWSTGENGANKNYIDQLNESTYNVTVRYKGVCEAVSSYTLIDPAPLVPSILPNSNYNGQLISCYNKTDASLKVVTNGGTGLPSGFSYAWNTGATTPIISNIGSGTYTITVKDVNQCVGTAAFTIDNPEPVQASIVTFSNYNGYGVSCTGINDGNITAAGEGGTGIFNYLWSNGKNTPTVAGLYTGTYEVTVSDNNGCNAMASHIITEPELVTLKLNSKKDISCFNGDDGSITLLATGGTNQYEYSKDNLSWQPASTFADLSVGTFQLSVRDQNGCSAILNETLAQPTKLDLGFTDIEPAFCSNPVGKATGVVSGGAGNYQYAWRVDGASDIINNSSILSGVPAGIYRLTIRDNNNCLIENTVGITSTDGAKTTYTSADAKCFDSADGSALITITAGDAPFAIQWPDGQNSLQGINLKKGFYNVSITDGHDCTVIETLEVKGPEPIAIHAKNESVPTCNTFCDGMITIEANGGVGDYTYEWNNSVGATQTQLCAGSYAVLARDANGCRTIKEIVLSQPDPISVETVSSKLATCKDGCDGELEVLASGGNGGYVYQWAIGGNTPSKTNLCPGFYAITIADQKGCEGAGVVQLLNTPALPLDLGGGVTLCVSQTYTLDAGSNWKTILWGSNTGLVSDNPSVTVDRAGSYWVDVTSDKGCVSQDTFLLETSYDLLKAQFVLATEAIVGDTVVMIDISWPLPQAIQWTHPQEMDEILNLGDVVFGKFDESGSYDVTLTTHLGECVDKITKTITILEDEDDNEGGRLGYEEFVKDFTLYPNPNDGSFDVGVQLLEESSITLSVWNSVTSVMVGKLNASGQKEYITHIDLRPLASGTYVLRLDHAKGKKYIRFVVH